MSLGPLINNQQLRIDDHKWGNKEIKKWDKPDTDIHIEKITKFKVEGKTQLVKIRIPLNSNREISVKTKVKSLDKIPRKLKKEINKAFKNKAVREKFVEDLTQILKNYSSILSNEEMVSQAIRKISKHFNLMWTGQKVTTYINDQLDIYSEIYKDHEGRLYFITIDQFKIRVGDIDQWSKQEVRFVRVTK